MILEKLDQLLAEAIKARDAVRITTLRLMKTRLTSASKAKDVIYDDKVEEMELRKMIKQNNESIEAYEKNNDKNSVNQVKSEIAIIEEFLPKLMTKEEVKQYIESIEGIKELTVNALKKKVFADLKGKADSKDINAIIKEYDGKEKV